MNKIWYEKKIKECESVKPEIERLLKEEFKISKKDFNDIMDNLESQYDNFASNILRMSVIMMCGDNGSFDDEYKYYINLIKTSGIEKLFDQYTKKNILHEYLNGVPVEFDGDILITDPCYIIRAKHHGTIPITKDDWCTCNYGYDMKKLGINHFMTRDTLYGDWFCTTFNSDTKQSIGNFCADAGLVSVMLLEEVLKYNPDYDCKKETEYKATIIRDFKGTVQFVVKHIDGYYEDTTDYHQKGDYWEEYYLEIVGHGIDKISGKSINFIGKQSGF